MYHTGTKFLILSEVIMKRFLSVVLAVIICVSCVPLAATAKRDLTKEEILAGELRDLGLFKGVSETDFALGRAPSRVEAVVMLIRVLGKEKEVTADKWRHPFTDVPAWADNYIGYAYSKGLTNGTSASTFGSGDASAAMYMTFMLRALGYSDTNGEDFTWSDPFTLAQETGIYPDSVNIKKFWRADVVLISHAALSAYVKGANATLARKLISDGVFTSDDFEKYYNVHDIDSIEVATGKELTPEEIYDICSPAVFYIEVYDEKGNAFASGSGFFIDAYGTAVTNFHVIDEALSATAFMSETGKQFKILGVYDYNVENDWAVIKVDCTGNRYLERDDGSTVIGAASVYAIGSPRGLQNTISTGIISNPERELDGVKYIQTTAPISHGSSGGALLNKYGEVIGITSASNTSGQSLNFALPISCIDGYKSGEITPLGVLNKPNIQYILSAQSVNVNVGETQYITLDLVTKGVHGETYSVSSEDSSIAQVGWTDIDSKELPWSITIVGVSPGTTFLNITNDYNGQYARVQINVAASASVIYKLSTYDVEISVGEEKYIPFDVEVNNYNADITFSPVTENASIATADLYADRSSNTPYICIKGVSAGTTLIHIENSATNQRATIKVTVKSVVNSGENAISYLKTMISRNGTYRNGVYSIDIPIESDYGNYFQRLGYNVSKDELFTDFLSYATPPSDYFTYSALEFHSDGTCTFVTAFYSSTNSKDPATYGSATIYSRTYTMSDSIYLSYYDGYSEIRETFSQLCASQLNLSLLYLNDYLRYCIGGISIADLGFTNFN